MRKTFKEILIEHALMDEKIVFLTGDLGFEFNEFKDKFPHRYFNMGVCEQTMIGSASGMALEGLKPFIYSITPFLLERPFEQIKIDIDHQKANVVLVGYADYPGMGPTHAELDWKTISPLFKNTKFYFPETKQDVINAIRDTQTYNGPAVLILKKAKD